MGLGHLLKNLDEEANLNLGRLLQECVKRCGPLGLAQDAEPLLDCTEFILEILIQGGRGHLLQGILVRLEVVDPLLCGLVEGLGLGVLVGDLRGVQKNF